MSLSRVSKPVLALVAFAVLALVLSACTFFKPGSLSLGQPGGVGSVRVQFDLCGEFGEGETPTCGTNEGGGGGLPPTQQSILGIAVPPGSSAPATITAAAQKGGPALTYTRNDQAAQAIAAASAVFHQEKPEIEQWPPAGTEGIGYISNVYTEEEGVREWNVAADFGLPAGSGGGSFGGPFLTSVWVGSRIADGENPADRPVHCASPSEEPTTSDALCMPGEKKEAGVSDLKIGAAAPATAYIGGKATLQFGLDFASTANPLPSFAVAATSTLPKAKATVSAPSFTPGAPDATTHRSPAASETVTVNVPKNAKPGVYTVTLTATANQGGAVSQVAQITVTKPKLKLGKAKLNKAKGTATLAVKVPSAGTLTISGKGIAKAQRKAKGAKTLKLPVKSKGKAKTALADTGKAKVKAKITFKPTNGAAVTKTKSITLKKTLAG